MSKRFTAEEIADICAIYNSGQPQRVAAEKYGVSIPMISRVMSEAGAKTRKANDGRPLPEFCKHGHKAVWITRKNHSTICKDCQKASVKKYAKATRVARGIVGVEADLQRLEILERKVKALLAKIESSKKVSE